MVPETGAAGWGLGVEEKRLGRFKEWIMMFPGEGGTDRLHGRPCLQTSQPDWPFPVPLAGTLQESNMGSGL